MLVHLLLLEDLSILSSESWTAFRFYIFKKYMYADASVVSCPSNKVYKEIPIVIDVEVKERGFLPWVIVLRQFENTGVTSRRHYLNVQR